MRVPARYLVHTATVEPYAGRSSVGHVYGDPFPVKCMASGKRRLVRDADGAERPSSLTLITAPGQADAIPAGSRVTWGAVTSTVMAVTDHDSGGLGAPDHTEVVCE